MRSLVLLGADGYIGSHLMRVFFPKYSLKVLVHSDEAARALQHFRTMQIFSGDILKPGILDDIIQKGDIVVNLVGTTTVAKDDREHFDVNVTGQHLIAQRCSTAGASVIYFSTINLYTSNRALSRESEKVKPENIYVLSKKMGEEVYEFYARKHGLKVVVLRLGSVYGPQHRKGVIWAMAQSLKERGIIEIPQTDVVRDFIYIDDVILSVEQALKYKKTGCSLFNISSGKAEKLLTVATLIGSLSANRGVVRMVPKDAYPKMVFASIAKAKRELGFKPQTTLLDGLRKTLASYSTEQL